VSEAAKRPWGDSNARPFALLGDGRGGVYYVTKELVEKMLDLIYFPKKEEK
jgi:hypothetical protein